MIQINKNGSKYMDNLYVIIVTYNGAKWIHKCLNSIYESTITSTILVVDNNSSDNTVQIIKADYPSVILFEYHKNLGFGKANNIGIGYALRHQADYVYLLNQDAWVEPDTFDTLIKIQKSNTQYGVLSPMQLNAPKDKLDDYFAALSIGKNKDNILSDIYLQKCKEVYEVDFVMAAHWLISKECLMNTGGFSPVFYHYGEDNNFLHRIHFHGYKSGVCPYLIAVHDREDRKRKPNEIFYLKYTSAFLVDFNNINNTLAKAFVKAYANLIIDEVTCMIKYKSLKPLIYICKSIFVFAKSRHNRKTTQNKGPVFLEITE